jgi:hypothetical protein
MPRTHKPRIRQQSIRQAITTKFLPATNHNPNRIKARCAAGSITISSDSFNYFGQAHHAAAVTLARKLKWSTDLIGGVTYSGEYVWILRESIHK